MGNKKYFLPLFMKIIYIAHFLSLFLLTFTGFYVHFPFFPGGMASMRFIHIHLGYIIMINFAFFLYWASISKHKLIGAAGKIYWIIVLCFQAITGFIMYSPYDWVTKYMQSLGGLMNVRVLHYLLMWLIIISTMIHLYIIYLKLKRKFV